MTERLCGCGCGAGISHLRLDAKYHPVCQQRLARERLLERKRAAYAARKVAGKPVRGHKLDQVSVHPRSHDVVRDRTDVTKPRRQKLCGTCSGMPHARLPDRRQDHESVAGPDLRCKECRQPYAPLPPLRGGPLLTSSAGTAAQAGKLYGIG